MTPVIITVLRFLVLVLVCQSYYCSKPELTKTEYDNITTSGIPDITDSIATSISKYQNARSAFLHGWMPDNSGILISTRFAEMNQLHIVRKPGGARHQITFRSDEVIETAICPDLSRNLILFTQDSGGNEQFQIYALNLSHMSIEMITDGKSQNNGIVWSSKGKRFVYESTRRNGKDWDIYLCDMNSPENHKMIFSSTGAWSTLDWSPDDSLLLLSRYISRTASFLYILDIQSGQLTPVHDTLDTVSLEAGVWDCRGEGIFLTSDEDTDFRSLRYYDLKSGKETILTPDINWDIREICMSPDRRFLIFSTNENGYSSVYYMDTRTFIYKKITGLPPGIIGSFHIHPSRHTLGCTITKANRPADVYTIDLNSFVIEQWTQSELGELDSTKMVTPELINYPSFDSVNGKQRQIPCFLYKPSGNGPFPVLISIHGGPETQYWPSFSPVTQYYVNELNIAVLAPNVRGSGGYGKDYLSLDNGFKREDAVKDIGALLEWISTQAVFDSSRIAVFGGSYGGYMTLASLIHFNKRIRAGIDLYGISNFITFLQKTAPYRQDLRRAEYGDEREPAMHKFLSDISPLNSATDIKCPLLIIQGANDPRVPSGESRQITEAVRKNGGNVWFYMPDDEGHVLRKKVNRDFQDCLIVAFLKEFLL